MTETIARDATPARHRVGDRGWAREPEFVRGRVVAVAYAVAAVTCAVPLLAFAAGELVAFEDTSTLERVLLWGFVLLWLAAPVGRSHTAWTGATAFRANVRAVTRADRAPRAARLVLDRTDRGVFRVSWDGGPVGRWEPNRDRTDPTRGWEPLVAPAPGAPRRVGTQSGERRMSVLHAAGRRFLWCERSRLLVDDAGQAWPCDAVLSGSVRDGVRPGAVELPADLGPHLAVALLGAHLTLRRKRVSDEASSSTSTI